MIKMIDELIRQGRGYRSDGFSGRSSVFSCGGHQRFPAYAPPYETEPDAQKHNIESTLKRLASRHRSGSRVLTNSYFQQPHHEGLANNARASRRSSAHVQKHAAPTRPQHL